VHYSLHVLPSSDNHFFILRLRFIIISSFHNSVQKGSGRTVVAECLTLLLHIRGVSGLDLGLETAYPDRISWFPQSLEANAGIVPYCYCYGVGAQCDPSIATVSDPLCVPISDSDSFLILPPQLSGLYQHRHGIVP
jgi:hypothetical protein